MKTVKSMENGKSMENVKSIITLAVIIAPALWFGESGKPTEMGLSIVAGSLAAGFLNIDKIELLKGAGFEARMREVVKEAHATIDNIKSLGRPVITSLLKLMVYEDRVGGMNQDEKFKLLEELMKISNSLEIQDDPEITETIKTLHRFKTWDMYSAFTHRALVIFQNKPFFIDLREALNKLIEFDTTNYPTKELVLSTIGEHADKLTPDVIELFDDYLLYAKCRQLRRPNFNPWDDKK